MSETTPGPATFVDWLNMVFEDLKKAKKLSIRSAVAESGVPRGTVYRWLKGATPDRDLVVKFCQNLGLGLEEPFAYFGWDPAGPSTPPSRTDLLPRNERIRKLLAVLEDPDLQPRERQRYESLMDWIIEDHENPPGDNGGSQQAS